MLKNTIFQLLLHLLLIVFAAAFVSGSFLDGVVEEDHHARADKQVVVRNLRTRTSLVRARGRDRTGTAAGGGSPRWATNRMRQQGDRTKKVPAFSMGRGRPGLTDNPKSEDDSTKETFTDSSSKGVESGKYLNKNNQDKDTMGRNGGKDNRAQRCSKSPEEEILDSAKRNGNRYTRKRPMRERAYKFQVWKKNQNLSANQPYSPCPETAELKMSPVLEPSLLVHGSGSANPMASPNTDFEDDPTALSQESRSIGPSIYPTKTSSAPNSLPSQDPTVGPSALDSVLSQEAPSMKSSSSSPNNSPSQYPSIGPSSAPKSLLSHDPSADPSSTPNNLISQDPSTVSASSTFPEPRVGHSIEAPNAFSSRNMPSSEPSIQNKNLISTMEPSLASNSIPSCLMSSCETSSRLSTRPSNMPSTSQNTQILSGKPSSPKQTSDPSSIPGSNFSASPSFEFSSTKPSLQIKSISTAPSFQPSSIASSISPSTFPSSEFIPKYSSPSIYPMSQKMEDPDSKLDALMEPTPTLQPSLSGRSYAPSEVKKKISEHPSMNAIRYIDTPSIDVAISSYILQSIANDVLPKCASYSSCPDGTGDALIWFLDETNHPSDMIDRNAMQERLTLAILYETTNGKGWSNHDDWLSSLDHCEWSRIVCSNDGYVAKLNLHFNTLKGKIPAEIGNLVGLEALYLSNNRLTGRIPTEIGYLESLKSVSFYSNTLTGTIPKEIEKLVKLKKLVVSNNHLMGTIPSCIGNLLDLEVLYLSNNNLTGNIPTEVGCLADLKYLHLYSNGLKGAIPKHLKNLVHLQILNLSGNQLSGNIPTAIGNLLNLKFVHLYSNDLSGTIPTELGNLANLQNLNLYSNRLTGRIPSEVGRLCNLKKLHVYSNALSGYIPKEILDLQLENLYADCSVCTTSGCDNCEV